MFSCEIFEIFKNTIFYRTSSVATSVKSQPWYGINIYHAINIYGIKIILGKKHLERLNIGGSNPPVFNLSKYFFLGIILIPYLKNDACRLCIKQNYVQSQQR